MDGQSTESAGLKPALPGRLWHYTTVARFLKIWKGVELWATSFEQLSDSAEVRYAHTKLGELAHKELESRLTNSLAADKEGLGRALDAWLRQVIEIWHRSDDRDESGVVAIFSLSEEGDLLSQWRAYGAEGGVAIGFDAAALKKALDGKGASLEACVYETADVEHVLQPLAEDLVDELSHGGFIPQFSHRTDFYRVAPRVKDPGFKEEKEWRIITDRLWPSEFHIRSSGARAVSYWPLALVGRENDEDDGAPMWRQLINAVRIGPSPHMDLSFAAIDSFLHRLAIEVERSEIPYRPL